MGSISKKIFLVVIFMPAFAMADRIQLGPYSGKPGYFVKIGTDSQLTLDAIVMNVDVSRKLQKLKFEKLGEAKQCDVDGMQQVIGYTIFKIKSCQ